MALSKKEQLKQERGLFYSVNVFNLSEIDSTKDENMSEVEVLRVGVIRDRGLKITKQMLSDFVQNWKDGVYGNELQVNLGHNREGEAAGWIKSLFIDPNNENRLMTTIKWTKLGVEKIKDELFKYVSAEFSSKYPHHETGKLVTNVFSGLALTNVPALKGQSPIALSEDIQLTNNSTSDMFKTYIETLNARAFVSKEDKELARSLFTALSEDEQAEHKEAVESVEAKPEVAEKTAEEKAKEEADAKASAEKEAADKAAAEAAKAKEGEEAKTAEALSEQLKTNATKLAEVEAKNKELSDKLERQELAEAFTADYQLSQDRKIGLLATSKDKVVSFLMELSTEQRAAFAEIIKEVRTVDLSVRGAAGTDAETTTAEDIKLAEERAQKSGKPVHEELTELYRERAK